MTTVGPVHFDLRATTSANKVKSANDTLGCDFNCRQASLVGIVSAGLTSSWDAFEWSLAVHLAPRGQPAHGPLAVNDSQTAAQNACPNTSSAHARQFDGSPEHSAEPAEVALACEGFPERGTTGKSDLSGLTVGRRRSGTEGWYGGRLSRIDWTFICGVEGSGTCTKEEVGGSTASVLKEASGGGCRAISRQTQETPSTQKPH